MGRIPLEHGVGGLPYFIISTKKGNFKFLIDCGSNSHMLSPDCAKKSSFTPYQVPPEKIKGINGLSTINEMIDIPLFAPAFQDSLTFVIMEFHPYFDGLIGTHFLLNPRIKLLLHEKRMEILHENKKISHIPLLFYYPSVVTRGSMLSHQSQNPPEKFRTDHLNDEERKQLMWTLNEIPVVFHDPDQKLTCTTVVQCDINTTDDLPVYQSHTRILPRIVKKLSSR